MRTFTITCGLLILILACGCGQRSANMVDRHQYWIGYTNMGTCDDPRGQYYNWRTRRATIVRADGTDRQEVAAQLIADECTWTAFKSWWPDGRVAFMLCRETPEVFARERAQKTFLVDDVLFDICVADLKTGEVLNLTAVERVSTYNNGGIPWPQDPTKVIFAPIIKGVQQPYVMDADGRNKRSLASGKEGFTYGLNISPDGRRIAYHKEYQIHVAEKDGSNPRAVDTDPAHKFQFCPTWSPDSQWLLFLAGEDSFHACLYLVRPDGTGLRMLADRGGYIGRYDPLKYPDFHSGHSDLPVWSSTSGWVYYTAKVGEAVELMRVSIDGQVQQLTRSQPGVGHFHPSVSSDGRLVAFGSTRDGAAAQYVANADGSDARPITVPTPGQAAMFSAWKAVETP